MIGAAITRKAASFFARPELKGEHMSKVDFDAFVKRQQAEQEKEAEFDPKQQLREWLGYLNALYQQIAGYLQTYVENGTAKITRRDIQLNEDFIGAYTAPEMTLIIGRSTITFTPIGTMLIGTKGRVDVQGPLGTARLSLVNKKVNNARQLIQVQVTVVRPGVTPPAPALPSPEAIRQIEWTWKLSTPPPEMKFIELTQETFFDMVLAVANA
jgi:hypothetical protein